MTESLEKMSPETEQTPIKCTAELGRIRMAVIRMACPSCKNEGLIPGPPFGAPERIQLFARGMTLKMKCGKCGALLELEQQLISTVANAPPRNRHEKRAAAVGVKPMLVKP